MIRIPQVRVVDEDGAQLGVMPTPQALAMAQERGYDLVEVAPMASPPVVKFLDFGQYKYELTKREKEAKRRQRSVTFKEVRLTPKIGSGDFDTKVHRAIEFLEEGDRIKVTVRFRGRELTHPELGRSMLQRFTDRIKEHGTPERAPLLEGKSMHLTVASLHKPKEHEVVARPPRPEAVGPNGAAPPDQAPAHAPTATTPTAATQTAEAPPAQTPAAQAPKATEPAQPAPATRAAAGTSTKAPASAGKRATETTAAQETKAPQETKVVQETKPATQAAAAPKTARTSEPPKTAEAVGAGSQRSKQAPAASPPAATGE